MNGLGQTLQEQVFKNENLLKRKHNTQLGALIKRITKDKNEQLRHRKDDSNRLL
jgi:hypothetical protein